MKKVLSIILSITMLLSITVGIDLSAYADTSGDFEYEILEDGTAEIINYSGSATEISIPSTVNGYTVTSISGNTIDWCESLTSITIPSTVTNITYSIFAGCTGLTNIDIDSNNAYYSSEDGVLFDKDKNTLIQYPIGNKRPSYTIPNGVKTIGGRAFAGCVRLTSVTMADSVTYINNLAFSNCESLKNIAISNSLTSIGDMAFSSCFSLTSIIIPDSVISIGNYAFYYCSSLANIIISDSITNIGDEAFSYCNRLTSVTIPNSVTTISYNAFSCCFGLENITVEINNEYYSSQDGVLFDKYRNKIIKYPIGNTRQSYIIPDGVKIIGKSSFFGCYNLTNIIIPESVTNIEDNAFEYCESLTNITIPNSVTRIGNDAFFGCSSLTSVIISDGLTSIDDGVFCGCTSLTSITIPKSLTSIGYDAFNGCRSLSDVYYNGTISDWNSIIIIGYNEELKNATVHCTDGVINEKEHEHIHNYYSVITAPTCTEKGYTIHTCECGDVYIDNYVNAAGHSWNSGLITEYPSCTATGVKTHTCMACGATKTEAVARKSHTYKTYTTKDAINKNGSVVTKCTVCGAVKSKSTIYYPKTIKLSKTSYTYNGKVQIPSVTVKDSKGKTLKKNTDYTVTYAKGRKNVGKYAVKITFKGKYSGSKTLYYTIKPKATSISKLTAGKKKFTVKWKKLTSQTTGYQIQYSTNKNFKSAKTATVSKNKTTSKSISKLKAKKKYYVRIRTYKTVGKTKYYSSWSKVKSVTTKR